MLQAPGVRRGSRAARKLEELTATNLKKLAQQKALADQFNDILVRQGGLNECAQATCKNLECAIAVAMRPGTIEYYRPPGEVTRIVENGELKALSQKILQLQRDIDQNERDIEQAQAPPAWAQAADPSTNSVNSLVQWFTAYGEPKGLTPSGFLTHFEDSPKHYGGTNHHRAFKTQARVMKKGRLTR